MYHADPQACQHDRQDVAQQLRAAPPAVVDLLEFFLQRPRLGGVLARRQLGDGRLQVAQHVGHAGVVAAVEGGQLVQDVMAALDGRVVKHLSAGDHLEGDAAEAQADLDARLARVLALENKRGRE